MKQREIPEEHLTMVHHIRNRKIFMITSVVIVLCNIEVAWGFDEYEPDPVTEDGKTTCDIIS